MKSKNKPLSRAKSREKKSRGRHPFFVGMLCLGFIFFGIAGYYKITGGGIRPIIQSGEMNDPSQTEIPDPSPASDEMTPTPPVNPAGLKDGVYTFLLAGIDNTANTDTIMVATLDTVNGTLNVLNIPRDTQVAVKRNTKKINAAWGVGGVDQLKTELKSVIGFSPDAYALVKLKGFVRLVDAIGGVDFDVPQNMKYRDPDQNLYIDLQKGPQHLDGQKAVELVRFRRYTEGDIKRVEMQQKFLKEVFRQTVSLKNLFKLSEFVKIAQEDLTSNIDLGQMTWLGKEIMKLDSDSITFHTLPGDPYASYKGLSYYLVYRDEMLALVNEYINPFAEPITEDKVNISALRGK